MHWDDLKVFLAVARAESLSGAGRLLRLDPATVGRRVARLEESLGTPLFLKSQQGYALSAAGARLLSHGEQAEQSLRAGVESVRGPTDRLSGQMRIGAPDGCANFLLPQVCAAISAENPDLEIQIISQPRVVNLSRREADMAITVSPPTAGRLLVQRICGYHLHLVGSAAALRAGPPILNREDLRGRAMVGYIPDMIFDAELDYLNDLGMQKVTLGSNSVSVQMRMVAEGGGLGIAHDFALPFSQGLVKLLPDVIHLQRSFYLVRHQDDARLDRLNRFALRLCDGLRTEISRLEALT
jgi:DNA-binding transcriptional LysR family regulator